MRQDVLFHENASWSKSYHVEGCGCLLRNLIAYHLVGRMSVNRTAMAQPDAVTHRRSEAIFQTHTGNNTQRSFYLFSMFLPCKSF